MSEKKSVIRYTPKQKAALLKVVKLPKGEKRTEAIETLAKDWGMEKSKLQKVMYNYRRADLAKSKKLSKRQKKSVGQKSYETRLRNQQMGIAPKTKKTNKRQFHNPPKEGAMQISRNELRFPFKKISIEGGDVVVSF